MAPSGIATPPSLRRDRRRVRRTCLLDSHPGRASPSTDRLWLRRNRRMDALDREILGELVRDARLSYRDLGARVGLSAPAAADRVRRLRRDGVITGFTATVNPPGAAGRRLHALIEVNMASNDSFEAAVSKLGREAVIDADHVTGHFDYQLRVAPGTPRSSTACCGSSRRSSARRRPRRAPFLARSRAAPPSACGTACPGVARCERLAAGWSGRERGSECAQAYTVVGAGVSAGIAGALIFLAARADGSARTAQASPGPARIAFTVGRYSLGCGPASNRSSTPSSSAAPSDAVPPGR